MAKILVQGGLVRRIGHETVVFKEGEKEMFLDWIMQIFMRRKSTEHCVFQLLQPIAYSRSPLCEKLPELSIPIAFMYGEHDWVGREVAD